jgi:tryptophan 2,3-dioxygenase
MSDASEANRGTSAPSPSYGSYLCLDRLLDCQRPATAEHDEMLFIVVHQVYELWFKQILHETSLLQQRLEDRNGAGALHTARRIAKILKTIVGQLDVLETMTPKQFASFRPELGSASGFQSNQFRVIEATLGRREFDRVDDPALRAALDRPTVYDSLLSYLDGADLASVYADEGEPAEVCEALVDIDEGVQEWRYRHVMMVQRIIGNRPGTGGSAGADYLRSTLFRPAFPHLWEVRGG